MKKLLFILLFFILTSGFTYADSGDQFLIPKVGFMSVDLNNADLLYSVGLLYGYGITPGITVEGELNLGVSGGKSDIGDYKIWTVAAYGVYRHMLTSTDYLKAKVGVLYENVEATSKATDTGPAGGLGFGFKVNKTIIELEATTIDQDIVFYSVGINHPFQF